MCIENYTNTAGSPTQDGQGEKVEEKVVKFRWLPRNGCDGWSMTKKLKFTTIQLNFVLIPSEAGMRTQIGLNCCY